MSPRGNQLSSSVNLRLSFELLEVQPKGASADWGSAMWFDVVILVLLCGFTWMGARRGAAVSAMGVATLVACYWAAIAIGKEFGSELASGLGLPEIVGIPIAGSLGFLLMLVPMTVLTRVIRNRSEGRDESPRDRFVGAAFGALRGAFAALLISYLALWVDALRLTGVEAIPEIGGSAAVDVTEAIVVAGVESAMSDSGPAARVVARIAGRPGSSLADLREVLESHHIENLQRDRSFWVYLEAGSIDVAMNQSSFLELSQDPTFRRQLGSLGLIEESAVADWRVFRESAREILEQVGPRIRGLRDNPELTALMEDPEIAAMVQSGDTFGLMGHERFRSVVAQVVSASPEPR
jgi:uncharacterized membrane protein required for colicin V production